MEKDKDVYDDDAKEIEEDKEDNGEPPSKIKHAELKATKHDEAFSVPCNYSTTTKRKDIKILYPFVICF